MKVTRFSRLSGVWLVLGLILSLVLAACGDPTATTIVQTTTTAAANTTSVASGQPTTASVATTTAAAVTTAAGAPVDLTVWTSPAVTESQSPPADWEGYKIIRDKLNINLKLTLLPAGTDGDTKLNVAAASNNLPDFFQSGNFDLFYKWQEQGLLAPVNSLLPLMPERTKLRYSDPNLNKLVTVNNSLYALQDNDPLAKVEGLVIRKDWLDKLG